MLICLISFFTALLFILLILPVKLVISYNKEASVHLSFLFIKKKIPIDKPLKVDGISSVIGELSRVKEIIFDLYSRLRRRLKIDGVKIYATVNLKNSFYYPLVFGAVNAALGAFIGALDASLGINKRKARILVNSAFLDTPAAIFVKITLKTSLFNFLLASTYTAVRAIFMGGKNGRKQAK